MDEECKTWSCKFLTFGKVVFSSLDLRMDRFNTNDIRGKVLPRVIKSNFFCPFANFLKLEGIVWRVYFPFADK